MQLANRLQRLIIYQKRLPPLKNLIYSWGHFIIDLHMNLLPPIMPLISHKIGLSLTLAATVLSVRSFTSEFLQPYIGYLIDRNQNKWLFPISIIWVSITMGLVGVIDNYYLLLFVSALSGVGSALYHPLGLVYTGKNAEGNKGLAVSFYTTSGNIGFSLGPVLIGTIVYFFGLSGSLIFIIPGIVTSVLFVILNQKESLLEKNNYDQNMPADDLNEQSSKDKTGLSFWNSFGDKIKWVVILVIIVIFRSTAHKGMWTFLPYYFQSLGYSELISGRLLSLFLIIGGLSGLLGGYLSDRYGRKIVTIITLIISACLLLGFINTSGVFSWVLLASCGGALLLSVPVTIVYAQELIPRNKALAGGLMVGFCYGIAGLAMTGLGAIAERWGLKILMYIFVFFILAGAVLIGLIPKSEMNTEKVGINYE